MKRRFLRVIPVLVASAVASCAQVSPPAKRLSYEQEAKCDVLADYWRMDGPARTEDRLYLLKPLVSKNHGPVALTREGFIHQLAVLKPARGFIVVTMAKTVDPLPDKSLDEAVRFFRSGGFQRVVIVQAEGDSPPNSGPPILRDTAHPN